MTTALIPVADLTPGDVLVTAYNTRPRTVTGIRLDTTTLAGGVRKRRAVQAWVASTDERRELYSDLLYLRSLVRVRR